MNLFREERQNDFADIRSATRTHKLDFTGFVVDSPKVVIERKDKKSPSAFSAKKFFGTRKIASKSPTTYKFKINEDHRKTTFSVGKRNISSELLDGIEQEVKIRPYLRCFRSGRLKVNSSYSRSLRTNFWKVSIIDNTVPESIIITSKTPISKRRSS
jgi:hypothetical protein